AAVVEAAEGIRRHAVGRQQNRALPGAPGGRAGIALLRHAIVARRARFVLIEDRPGAERGRDAGAGELVADGRRRVQVLVRRLTVRMAERVEFSRLREGDLRFERREKRLVVRRGAAVVIELHDVDVAGHLRDVGLDVWRLRGRGAAAAGEIAGDEVVEIVVLDERADALRVQVAR